MICPGYATAWHTFCGIVLNYGGALVVPPLRPDPEFIAMIGDHGAVVSDATKIEFVVGVRSGCHTNAVALWRTGGASAIGTGYALSDDSLWREHSWGWGGRGELIETTVPRIRYFGVRFADAGAEIFAQLVIPRGDDSSGVGTSVGLASPGTPNCCGGGQ